MWNRFAVVWTISTIIWATFGGTASAFRLIDQQMSEKFQSADIVVVARAVSSPRSVHYKGKDGDVMGHSVSFETESVMKGDAPAKFEFLISGRIHELNVQCCVTGERYLLYVRKVDGTLFVSVLGRFGVYRLSEQLHD